LKSRALLIGFALILTTLLVSYLYWPSDKIDYNTQVKPIFNKKCIACHGGVKQKAGFSLLFREEALGNTESGRPAIIPGNPDESELIRRITETDPEERMPYKHEPLSKGEIEILTQWIKQGAEWGEHWAYLSVKDEPVPGITNQWIRNDIDNFILNKLQAEKIQPSSQADKPTLLRRVSLDLTGLPPEKSVASKFLNDTSDLAYENLVNELLASPTYGERWTSLWMDLARYADTRGYEADRSRTIWKYRDWLIKAFNDDKPYNEFLEEQMAGDLMPNPDDAKYIATAFHRNTMTNDEGGTENEEFRTAAVLDRVNTTWSALMGTTFNCVQCHSHPYDPFKHEEYYKFVAFFNNTRDEDTQAEYPVLRQYSGTDSLKLLQVKDWLTKNISPEKGNEYYTFLKTWQPTINSLLCDEFKNAALISSWHAGLRNQGSCRLQNVTLDNRNQLMVRYTSQYEGGQWSIYLDSLNGRLLKTIPISNTKNEWKILTTDLPLVSGTRNLYFKYYNPSIKSLDETGVMFEWFQFGQNFPGKGKTDFDVAYKNFNELMYSKVEATPILIENNQEQLRATHVFERGNWLVKGDEVTPEVPQIMNPMDISAPKNRLGLAMWLTDKKNPLVARTMVNRLWEQLFGFGLVETLEDFGTQGIAPTHKELLDHLSWQFMNDFDWSLKKLLKEMVMSATYRQDSKTNDELIRKDPENKLYARGPRIRLSAEQLRDQALVVSNLISKKMYGKSVMPYQPDGIWRSPYNGDKWMMSKGEDQNRRALYTYWKRTAPYPSMLTFDGGAREVCVTQRIRTNTPLQALTTLNDSTYFVMAQSFAFQMQLLEFNDVKKQIQKGYESMLFKPISDNRLNALVELYSKSMITFAKDKKAAHEIVGEGRTATPETAALVVVANAMLNLDEWVNKN
jgi:mono/diheme cytochrome c family protein